MTTVYNVFIHHYNGEIVNVSVAISDALTTAYRRAGIMGDEHMQKRVGDVIDDVIIDEICAVYNISHDDRQNIDFRDAFEELFICIYRQL